MNANTLLLIVHVLIAAAIILLVLMQRGKGADAGAGFGAGASGTVFGARGSGNFLSRSTAIAATLFFATSMALAYVNRNAEGPGSLLDSAAVETAPQAETLPALESVGDSMAGDAAFELPELPAAAPAEEVETGLELPVPDDAAGEPE